MRCNKRNSNLETKECDEMRWEKILRSLKLFDSCCDDRSTVDCKISGKKIKVEKKIQVGLYVRFPCCFPLKERDYM